ncbi:ATP-binding cassette domain-containing protein [Desulfobotulus sp.]|jgi:ABC-type iron transport system FetAB ATPase subunit|uniref:ABC transporter ATP-binding protein n=1 Tax=Desulfobotulus sp. TaxID=1940337 RepID=UPI002A367338|nr:ATP-binding cassette domain-containing protein [Desulfobotulus sp.]MDY0162085.1 ATP-binding cassette domain-containing protein [Desulfobotulus sp.]
MFRAENLRIHHIGPLSFSVKEGECAGISGPSGTGKTILLRALADMEPFSGRLWLEELSHDQIPAPQWRRRVALLPAESQWWFHTVAAHFPGGFPEKAAQVLGLGPEVAAWEIHRLSSGEKQRLSLLRILENRPRVLLLDEPTANLDPKSARAAETLILDFQKKEQAALLWISHDPEQLNRVCHTLYHLENGYLSLKGKVLH